MPEKNSSLFESFRHAFEGLKFAVREERNMKIHLSFTLAVLVCAIALGLTAAEKAIVIGLCGIVLMAELFNTAIENAVDLAAPGFNMYAKRAKDTAAAAVLVLSIGAAAAGLIIFVPYGLELLGKISALIQQLI